MTTATFTAFATRLIATRLVSTRLAAALGTRSASTTTGRSRRTILPFATSNLARLTLAPLLWSLSFRGFRLRGFSFRFRGFRFFRFRGLRSHFGFDRRRLRLRFFVLHVFSLRERALRPPPIASPILTPRGLRDATLR